MFFFVKCGGPCFFFYLTRNDQWSLLLKPIARVFFSITIQRHYPQNCLFCFSIHGFVFVVMFHFPNWETQNAGNPYMVLSCIFFISVGALLNEIKTFPIESIDSTFQSTSSPRWSRFPSGWWKKTRGLPRSVGQWELWIQFLRFSNDQWS